MPVVLGIDAAWTAARPSGVALTAKKPTGWHLIAVAPSYCYFISLSRQRCKVHLSRSGEDVAAHCMAGEGVPPTVDSALAKYSPVVPARPSGSLPEVAPLLAAASSLCGDAVDLVAADIPLARSPIVGRRYSDNQVSRAYGSRKCGAYTPSIVRPGALSDVLTKDFARAGYPLLTQAITPPGVIEVYPHPALVELSGARERLPYKASKVGRYWPSATPLERRGRLFQQWHEIAVLLEGEIAGVTAALPQLGSDARGVEMKAHEDMLDAIICAWVGICALDGRAMPYGDDDAAIWVPKLMAARAVRQIVTVRGSARLPC
jgi:predicted RNase H-like nuclease